MRTLAPQDGHHRILGKGLEKFGDSFSFPQLWRSILADSFLGLDTYSTDQSVVLASMHEFSEKLCKVDRSTNVATMVPDATVQLHYVPQSVVVAQPSIAPHLYVPGFGIHENLDHVEHPGGVEKIKSVLGNLVDHGSTTCLV